MEDLRLQQLSQWARTQPGLDNGDLSVASADASFRRYFRVTTDTQSYVLMDAPPDKEDTGPFTDITHRLELSGLPVPHIHALDSQRGFLMLDDFGNTSLLSMLDQTNVDHWYTLALSQLLPLQGSDTSDLPLYDQGMLLREMELFREWFLGVHLGLELSDDESVALDQAFETLAASALKQPTAFVHRDYHSRNLMVVNEQTLGIIDYQDAVLGPVTYDAVSLLRDCYVSWPQPKVESFALQFKQQLEDAGMLSAYDDVTFMRWFDLMGTQRHLKAIGIFARLNHRDRKPGYLSDIPRTLNYVLECAERHTELEGLAALVKKHNIVSRLAT